MLDFSRPVKIVETKICDKTLTILSSESNAASLSVGEGHAFRVVSHFGQANVSPFLPPPPSLPLPDSRAPFSARSSRRYSAPVVCLSPMVPSVSLSSSLGVPNNPSYVPSVWLYYSDRMSFAERLYNAAIGWAESVLSDVLYRAAEQRLLDTGYVYPGHRQCPPLDRLRETVSLTLVNSHWSVSYARPYQQHVVSVAGMHMRPPPSSSSSSSMETVSPV